MTASRAGNHESRQHNEEGVERLVSDWSFGREVLMGS